MRKLNFKNLSNIEETIIFKDKIGRIRDIQIHPVTGKLYFLADNKLWVMKKKK
jgi:quinoprotein glucose dehydrogenase